MALLIVTNHDIVNLRGVMRVALPSGIIITSFSRLLYLSFGFPFPRNLRSAPSAGDFLYDRNILTRGIICDVIALILKEEGAWCHISGRFIFVLEKSS
jgi:hypothetical protein